MCLHANCCGPPGWKLDKTSVEMWSRVNSDAIAGRELLDGDLMAATSDDEWQSATDDEESSDDIDEDAFRQQDEDYSEGFCNTESEDEDCLRFEIENSAILASSSSSSRIEVSVRQLAPRFAAFTEGREDKVESRRLIRRRWENEDHLEDLCAAFSATPKGVNLYDFY
jgi:hypothetical protein